MLPVLIDSSSWIEALRTTGRADVRHRVHELMLRGEAAWCDMIRLELWNGARGEMEKAAIKKLDRTIINFAIDAAVWGRAMTLAVLAREKGLTVPAADLVIFAVAQRYAIKLEHNDRHLTALSLL